MARKNNRWPDKTWQERFWEKVTKDGPIPKHRPELGQCWEWTAYKKAGGYGTMLIAGKTKLAPRLSWEIHNGPIPPRLNVLHECDYPPCTNPAHLFLGTQRDNTRDAMEKGRHCVLRGEQHGCAKLGTADVIAIRASTDSRVTLAKQHGVHRSNIGRIQRGESWTHITSSSQSSVVPSAPCQTAQN